MSNPGNNNLERCHDAFEISKIKYDELEAAKQDVKAELEAIREKAAVPLDHLVGDSVDISKLRSEFGSLFYGCLEPINGHNIKDRRYFDEEDNPTESFDNARRGSAGVFKRIGKKSPYRKNTSWYDEHQVFDKLDQDHVNLIHNGKYSRYDHKEVAQEFLDVRDEINGIRADWKAKEIIVHATETMPLSLIYHSSDHMGVITDVLSTTVDYWMLQNQSIYLYPVQTEATRDKNVVESFSCDYRTNGPEFIESSDWRNKFTVDGWHDVLSDPRTVKAKLELDKMIQEAEDKLDELKLKYANRLVVKGLF